LGWVEATVPCPANFVVTREVEAIATNRRIVWPFSAMGTKPREETNSGNSRLYSGENPASLESGTGLWTSPE